jgi:hypothetical protein
LQFHQSELLVTTLTTLAGCALLVVGIWGSLTTLWRENA